MTELNPNGRIAGISVENLTVELGGELPLPRVSCTIGQSNKIRLPAQQTGPREVNHPVRRHFVPD
jgi:hypothetical protein